MSCDISLGRLEACKQNVGGLKNVYFVNYSKDLLSGATITGNVISALASSEDA